MPITGPLRCTWRRRDWNSAASACVARPILVQLKLRHHGVGRSDLPSLRDTLDYYCSDGLLAPRGGLPSDHGPLMDHLSALRWRGQMVGRLGATELEARIRRHPEITARYVDSVGCNRLPNPRAHNGSNDLSDQYTGTRILITVRFSMLPAESRATSRGFRS